MGQVLTFAVGVALVLSACSAGSDSASAPDSARPSGSTSSKPAATPAVANGVTEEFDLGFRPSGIVVAGDVIWAEDHAETFQVYAMDPMTGETKAEVRARWQPERHH